MKLNIKTNNGNNKVSAKIIRFLKKMLLDYFKNDDVSIVLFGSRAKGTNKVASDIDIAILAKNSLPNLKLTVLREKLENSKIPYKIDLINLFKVSGEFKNRILKEGIYWKK